MDTATALDAGRSIYRGYAASGLGDGPGRPITRGEQFLAADGPFDENGELLVALRPWMTLDLDAGDHRRLGERLEAWSSFAHQGWVIVVRLAPAGTFDHRTAYFAHARAFPETAVWSAGDPGALLGRSEAFESPWLHGRRGDGAAVPAPELAPHEPIAAEPEAAASLLAHLLQAVLAGCPVVVAVPVEDLATGAPLPALVSFARAALPPRLKAGCRLRVYSRTPDLFLGRLGCHLLVVPQEAASDALAVRRDAVLLDRKGRRLAGAEPVPGVRDWAEKVVLWACERPGALLEFASRYGERVWDGSQGPPREGEVASVGVAYRLAEELAGDGAPSRNLFMQLRNATARMGSGAVPWRSLLTPEDWSRFPGREVLELVLADPDCLPEGVRALQEAATDAARELGWSAGELLGGSWAPIGGGGFRRLLDLSGRLPRLVPGGYLERCLLEVPVATLVEERLLAGVLELPGGIEAVTRRAEELVEQPGILADEEVRRRIFEATLDGRLAPSILDGLVRSAAAEGPEGARLAEWLEPLAPDRLLLLAARLDGGDGPLATAVAEALSIRMRRDPVETGALLIRRGAWSWWRRRARVQPSEARSWALAWLDSPAWDEPPRVEPWLDDWELVMVDVGQTLDGRELVARLEEGQRAWPRIPLFADRQLEDLARRMPDLGTLALLVERWPGEEILPRPLLEERALSVAAAERPHLRTLAPESLRWLGEVSEPSELPSLPAGGFQRLYSEAGARKGQLVENLALWLESSGSAEAGDGELLAWLDGLGEQRSSPASDRARALARQLVERGHVGTARFLDPELDTLIERREGARRFVAALATGQAEDPYWRELHRELVSSQRGSRQRSSVHPFRALAGELSEEAIPERAGDLRPGFFDLLDRYPGLFAEADRNALEPLPAFELAAVLFEDLPAGTLAVRFAYSAPGELTERESWWLALLRGVEGCRRGRGRRCGLDRPDLARALLARSRHDLPDPARVALNRVLFADLDRANGPAACGVHRRHDPGGEP